MADILTIVGGVTCRDNGEVFRVDGSNASLARFCPPQRWEELSAGWKLEMLMFCCYAADQVLAKQAEQVLTRRNPEEYAGTVPATLTSSNEF